MVQHEDQLRDHRLGWLLTLNGFMFASVGLAWQHPETGGLLAGLAGLGVVVGISAVATMRVSDEAIRHLDELSAADVIDGQPPLPPVRAVDSAHFRGLPGWERYLPHLYIWNLVPWALVLAWAVVLVALVRR
ncbi:MAG TPA: hypothetical protein VEW93_10775 [Acidimicrobiales bacterium]|nr:hypothetical protein [Acidimicrobiales bacterium]